MEVSARGGRDDAEMPAPRTQLCNICSVSKPMTLDHFYSDGQCRDGTLRFRTQCKTCLAKVRRLCRNGLSRDTAISAVKEAPPLAGDDPYRDVRRSPTSSAKIRREAVPDLRAAANENGHFRSASADFQMRDEQGVWRRALSGNAGSGGGSDSDHAIEDANAVGNAWIAHQRGARAGPYGAHVASLLREGPPGGAYGGPSGASQPDMSLAARLCVAQLLAASDASIAETLEELRRRQAERLALLRLLESVGTAPQRAAEQWPTRAGALEADDAERMRQNTPPVDAGNPLLALMSSPLARGMDPSSQLAMLRAASEQLSSRRGEEGPPRARAAAVEQQAANPAVLELLAALAGRQEALHARTPPLGERHLGGGNPTASLAWASALLARHAGRTPDGWAPQGGSMGPNVSRPLTPEIGGHQGGVAMLFSPGRAGSVSGLQPPSSNLLDDGLTRGGAHPLAAAAQAEQAAEFARALSGGSAGTFAGRAVKLEQPSRASAPGQLVRPSSSTVEDDGGSTGTDSGGRAERTSASDPQSGEKPCCSGELREGQHKRPKHDDERWASPDGDEDARAQLQADGSEAEGARALARDLAAGCADSEQGAPADPQVARHADSPADGIDKARSRGVRSPAPPLAPMRTCRACGECKTLVTHFHVHRWRQDSDGNRVPQTFYWNCKQCHNHISSAVRRGETRTVAVAAIQVSRRLAGSNTATPPPGQAPKAVAGKRRMSPGAAPPPGKATVTSGTGDAASQLACSWCRCWRPAHAFAAADASDTAPVCLACQSDASKLHETGMSWQEARSRVVAAADAALGTQADRAAMDEGEEEEGAALALSAPREALDRENPAPLGGQSSPRSGQPLKRPCSEGDLSPSKRPRGSAAGGEATEAAAAAGKECPMAGNVPKWSPFAEGRESEQRASDEPAAGEQATLDLLEVLAAQQLLQLKGLPAQQNRPSAAQPRG